MEKFKSFEINGENVLGGTSYVATPSISVPSVKVNVAPAITAVKSTLGGTLGKVGGILSSTKKTASSLSTKVSASAHIGLASGTSHDC
ncbi:MAG: hypothetical protein U5M51_11320 [Emticicia sp.]|nr:hypothetical protein [Emticicia sp.]